MDGCLRSELDLIQLYALVLHLFVLNTFILIQFIHLNASICSVNLYTSSILIHLCTCLHLFVQASAIPCTRCSYMRQAGSSRYHRFTDSHLWGNYRASFTLIHLWGIIYNYARIHLYTYTRIHLCSIIYNATN